MTPSGLCFKDHFLQLCRDSNTEMQEFKQNSKLEDFLKCKLGYLDQGCKGGDGEKWIDSGYVLEIPRTSSSGR